MKTPGKSGHLTVVLILLFSILFVGGLYYYSRRSASPEYQAATPGVPPQRLRFISCDLEWRSPTAKLIQDLAPLKPDFVLVQRVSHKDAEILATALDMRHNGQLQLYYSPTNPDTRDVPGNAILARHPLYQGRAIADQAKTAGIASAVFDRGGFLYHGRIKALADAAREAGLEF